MHQNGYIGRKLRLPKLKEKPAIIVAAFGSSSRGKAALTLFHTQLEKEFPDYEKFMAYTSGIICKKEDLPGLQEVLAQVEAAGYRRAIVQPLHIFPGTEYQQMAETCEYFPGLRVFLSETLLHRWDFIHDTLKVLETEFLAPPDGLNLLAFHGTPLAADPVNSIYLGLDKIVTDLYSNVITASVEGIPDHRALFCRMKRQKLADNYRKIKIIPMMYLAGIHVEDDLMGAEESWRTTLEDQGFQVKCPTVGTEKGEFFKGLAYYPEVINFMMSRLKRTVELATYY